MKRLLVFAMLLGIAGAAALTGQLQSAEGSSSAIPSHIAGVVPVIGTKVPGAGSPLLYHGGPVMTTNKTYAIYWKPASFTMAPGYDTTINQYFTDVAADSNKSTNVYAVDTQYSGIQYSSSFGGAVTDTTPFPSSGCPNYTSTNVCLTDAQIQTEVNSVIASQGWIKNGTNMFFLFTPQNVGSCFDSSGSQCAFTVYCAYHGFTDVGSAIYANEPYLGGVGGCDQGQYPNGSSNQADPSINVISHEHNEAITDPQLNAWYDSGGNEIGDKCAWMFGTVSGPAGAEYNETINSHHYYLQMEFSNSNPTNTCVQTYQIQGGGGGKPTITSFSPSRGRAGTLVTINGTNLGNVTQVLLRSTSASIVSETPNQLKTRVPNGVTGLAKWTVKNPAGSALSASYFCAC